MVTLSLMILLTVIAVGLLSLSSISLRASTQGGSMATARANARMALMLAIGELQREMGPDSRISAPHDAGNAATSGSPRWTAVYDAWTRPTGNSPETPDSRVPRFRGWLASGANAALGGSQGTSDRALLVGPGSLGGNSNAADEVRVPMHKVVHPSRPGRFAWWISDEGVKAKINAGPDAVAGSSLGSAEPLFHSQAPPKVEHRVFPELADLQWNEGKRAKTISTHQVSLAAGLASGGLGRSIHDLTVNSVGLLTNVRDGRLQRDLGNLLARPVAQLTDKPLYLADGRMNSFTITKAGAVSNSSIVNPWEQSYNSAGHWGINLEELHLFHSIHRELTWSGGRPGLRTKGTREAVVSDRYYMYRRPNVQALQFIFSMQAVPAGGAYKIQMNLDAMVALSNPNDVPLVYSPGLVLPFQLLNIPYELVLKTKKGSSPETTTTTRPPELQLFRGHVEGGTSGIPAAGFTLEPGEAAVFGSSTANNFDLNLKRGFDPSGGVKLANWDLKTIGLSSTDTVDFEFKRIASPKTGQEWIYYNVWNGPRTTGSGGKGWQMDTASLTGGSLTNSLMDQLIPPVIKSPGPLTVSQLINTPKAVLLVSFLQNVEQESSTSPPDAFASRPFQLNEPALTGRTVNPDRALADNHGTQMLITAEPMNYQFRTLASGEGGRNLYIGGGRQPGLGGSFNVISRRIPVAPPLSLGAFQNAIASGFSDHFAEEAKRTKVGGGALAVGGDPFPSSAVALTGHVHALPLVSKSIGNSHGVPHLQSDEVFREADRASKAARGAIGKVASDHSWMVNTALWDSWFLSSIVDGAGTGSSAWQTDKRSPRSQFSDFANGKNLRNKRYVFYPHKPAGEAIGELFNGQNLKPDAINTLSKYLLIDGAFNVNSTSVLAWTALLSSIRDQDLITANGSKKVFNHAFGTLGYAASAATSGPEGDWSGLRDLDESEMKSLASAIVTEVKARGPFLSLADFVNRRPNASDASHQALGALQAAINLAGLNDRQASGNRKADSEDFADLSGGSGIDKEPKPARAVGSAGYLSQGSLLTAIGSQIAVRSDTFAIRAYGDARDSSDKIVARAWCEAVIQRVPEYVDTSDAPEAQNGWPAPSDTISPLNVTFGRRMEIRSFRWLSSVEI